MANSSKNNLWLVIVLVVAGAAFFLFSLKPKPDANQGVVLGDIFSQKPQQTAQAPAVANQPPAAASVVVKDPVSSPAIVTSPENGHEAGFVVQVYSFQDKNRADKALTNLKAAGHKAFMEVSDLGEKGTWYRVRIGGLENEQQAKNVLEEIRKNYNSGFIVKPKK